MALNDRQAAFVQHFTSDIKAMGNGAESARRAGYAESSARETARLLQRNPEVQAAIHEALKGQLSGSLATKAVKVLELVLDDAEAPHKVRLDAARIVLDRGGFGPLGAGDGQGEDKSIAEMSPDELHAILKKAQASLADKAAINDLGLH